MNLNKVAQDFAEIEQLAKSHQLGEPELSFKNPEKRVRSVLLMSIVYMCISPASALLCSLNIVTFVENRWFLPASWFLPINYSSMILCGFGIGLFRCGWKEGLPLYKRLKKEQVHLFDHGFIYFDEKKNQLSAFRWEQIKGLGTCSKQRGTKWLTGLAIITEIPEEKTFTEYFCLIPDLAELQEICELINRAYIDCHLPLRLQDYERGEKLVFDIDLDDKVDDDGNISLCTLELSREGMKQILSIMKDHSYFPEIEKEKFISWDEIASIEMEERSIVIKTKEPRILEGVSRTSDIWLMAERNPWGDMGLLWELLERMYH